MQATVYCRHCGKTFETPQDDLVRVQLSEPEHTLFSGNTYRYSGGCYFKTLNRLKRMEKHKTDNKDAS